MTRRPLQRGFSLVELMIAITLGLLLTLGVINIFISSKRGYRVQDSIGRMQENSRFAVDYLSRAVHLADFWSGIDPTRISTIGTLSYNGAGGCDAAWLISTTVGLRGYTGGTSNPTDLPAGCLTNYVPNSDVLVIRNLDPDGSVGISATTDAQSLAALADSNAHQNGKYFVRAAAGTQGRLFDASVSANRTTAVADLPTSAETGDAINYRYQVQVYYLATFPGDNSPTLYVWRMQQNDMERVPLVAGVEMMKFEYGVDTNADLLVDGYRAAGNVTNWNQVLTVRMSLILRGDALDQLVDGDSYNMSAGYTYTPAAGVRKYMRTLVIKEAQIRNRVRVK